MATARYIGINHSPTLGFSDVIAPRAILIIVMIVLFAWPGKAQERPNVLFIAVDDLNDFVSCMNGSLSIPTPNIDRIAASGTLFTNAHCQAPLCGPSRASIMTGMYPSTTGNYLQMHDTDIKKSNEAVKNATFLPDYFEENGYKTMAVGKIYHHGDAAQTFDEYGGIFDFFGPRPKERMNYDPFSLPNKSGKTMTDWGAYPDYDSLMPDYKSAKWAVEKLSQNHDKPFMMAVGFIRPHVPWHVPQKWFDMFPIENIATPPYLPTDMDDVPEMGQKVSEAPMMPTADELIASGEWKEMIQAYSACVAFVDAQIGKVLDALEASQYANNTIVVIWADHGYHLGEKNRVAKQALWERDTRTLLAFRIPRISPQSNCNAPVQLLDIYPTLLDACNLPPLNSLEGNSLTELIAQPDAKWKNHAVSMYGEQNVTVRDCQYRLIQYEDGSQELYDLKADPNEWKNLALDPKHAKTIKNLLKSIPEKWAPLSEHSSYSFNEYFKQKSKALKY
ncbi:MAG: sulfatase [Cyclobacteriaceae bacterium]